VGIAKGVPAAVLAMVGRAVKFSAWHRFSEIPTEVRGRPGLYEIRCGRVLLKVGISGNLGTRLKQHRDSLQRRLVGPAGKLWKHPDLVVSKASVLAKHLYFDETIAPDYQLRTESGRQRFLEEKCQVRWQIHEDRESAKRLEATLEKSCGYRYRGRVQIR